MKMMMTLAFLAVSFAGVGVRLAGDPQRGTWKLNEAKSKLNPEAAKITRSVYTTARDGVKITVDGVDKDGRPVHDEWTGKFDGKDYPVTGDPRSDMRSYRKIDDHTLELTAKKAGNVVAGGFIVISPDGTSRTAIAMTSDPSGNKVPLPPLSLRPNLHCDSSPSRYPAGRPNPAVGRPCKRAAVARVVEMGD